MVGHKPKTALKAQPCPRCNAGLYWGPKKTMLQIVCQKALKAHTRH